MTGMRAEANALATFGRERYEDATVFNAVGRYLSDVGAVPAQAWGTLPISGELANDWAGAVGNRIAEAQTAQQEMTRMADGLLQIAADYEGTDVQVATTFDLINKDLQPYLTGAEGYSGQISTRPGGAGVSAVIPDSRPDYRPDVEIPPGNERLAATRHEVLPSVRVVEADHITIGSSDGNDLIFDGGTSTYYDNGEGDALDRFVQEYKDALVQLEGFIQTIMTGHKLPLSDLIVHAWRSSPKVIRNRADLIHSAANTHAELGDQLDGERKRLNLYWEGTAATAFGDYASGARSYIAAIEAEATWLAEEGKKAASLLEGLRNAYAALGYERIGTLLQAMDDYRHRLQGMFSPCDGAEKGLLKVVDEFVTALVSAEVRHVEGLAELIKVDEQIRKERPDLGTRAHEATPFPQPEVGGNAWTEKAGWAAKPGRPAA